MYYGPVCKGNILRSPSNMACSALIRWECNSATTATDTLRFISDTSVLSANSVLGMDGNDLLVLGVQGRTGVASARATYLSGGAGATGSGTYTLSTRLVGQDITYSGFLTYSGIGTQGGTTGIAVTGIVTSQAGVRTVGSSNFYGNAGNDTIALGAYSGIVSTYSSTTFGGGAGNDLIGTIGYVADLSATNTAGTASVFEKNFFEGGGNNDTINVQVDSATFSANTLQGSQGTDCFFVTNNARVAISQSNLLQVAVVLTTSLEPSHRRLQTPSTVVAVTII